MNVSLPELFASLGFYPPGFAAILSAFSVLACSMLAIFLVRSRRRLRRYLRMRSELLAVIEHSADGVIGMTLDGTVTSWDGGASELFGYDSNEALGRHFTELLGSGEPYPCEAGLIERVANGEAVVRHEIRMRRRDGSNVDVAVALVPIMGVGGDIVGVSGAVRDITEKKAADSELSKWNMRFEQQVSERTRELDSARRSLQTVLDAVPSMIGYWDRGLINRFANHAYNRWFGVDPEALPGTSLRELLGEPLFEANRPRFEAALRGEAQTFERAIPQPDGGVRHSLAHYVPDVVDGHVLGFYAIVHDVTELTEGRMRLDAALRKNDTLLQTINDQLLFSETDLDGRIVDVNDNFCRTHGYTREQLLGQNHRLLNSGQMSPDQWREFWSTLSSGQVWRGEISNRAADGSILWFDTVVAPVMGDGRRPVRYIALRINITERLQAAHEVDRLNQVLQDVLRSASEVSIVATDKAGLITVFNSGAERMLGYRAEEMVGKETPARFHLAAEVDARVAELRAELGMSIAGFQAFTYRARRSGAETREWTYVRKDGSRFQVALSVTAMRDSAGIVTGYLGIATDITARKESEARMLDAKRMAEQASLAKSQFLANMSHEIRTPLNAVLGMLELLRGGPLDENQRGQVESAQTAARSLLGVLNDILDYSKVEAGKMQLDPHPFDVEGMFRELGVVLSANLGAKQVELLFDIDPQLPRTVVGDRLRILQILVNLSGNAIKFTSHGHVIVKAEKLALHGRQAVVRFTVLDSGIGISKDQISRIFDSFSQAEASTARRFGGTGLGLAISKRLARLMGGDLELESEVGLGSRFWLDLTLGVVGESIFRDTPGLAFAGRGLRILVADDDAVAGSRLVAMLEMIGWTADLVACGHAVAERVALAQAAVNGYDLVLMDWRTNCSGVSAARAVRDLPKTNRPPVMVAVASATRKALENAIGDGDNPFDGFLVKPITPQQLCDAILDTLGMRKAVSGNAAKDSAPRRLAGMRLLIVEDNALNRQVAYGLLSREGAHVTLAEGGLEGIARALAPDADFDVIIMDVQMPDVDGYEATRRIRAAAHARRRPILAMTANASREDRDHCLSAGMDDHVGKPIDMAELVPTLLRLAGRSDNIGAMDGNGKAPGSPSGDALLEPISTTLARLGGDMALYRAALGLFETERLSQLAALSQACLTQDAAAFAATLHDMKSGAASVGAKTLAELASRHEFAIKAAQQAGTACAIDQARMELCALSEASAKALHARIAAVG